MNQDDDVILDVRDLKVHFPVRKTALSRPRATLKAVDGVSLQVRRGQTGSTISGRTNTVQLPRC